MDGVILIYEHMGVQKSRKSSKYTKCSLQRQINSKNTLRKNKLSGLYAHRHRFNFNRSNIFSIISSKNTQNLFF